MKGCNDKVVMTTMNKFTEKSDIAFSQISQCPNAIGEKSWLIAKWIDHKGPLQQSFFGEFKVPWQVLKSYFYCILIKVGF